MINLHLTPSEERDLVYFLLTDSSSPFNKDTKKRIIGDLMNAREDVELFGQGSSAGCEKASTVSEKETPLLPSQEPAQAPPSLPYDNILNPQFLMDELGKPGHGHRIDQKDAERLSMIAAFIRKGKTEKHEVWQALTDAHIFKTRGSNSQLRWDLERLEQVGLKRHYNTLWFKKEKEPIKIVPKENWNDIPTYEEVKPRIGRDGTDDLDIDEDENLD